jgi:hypothetical protein
MDTNYSRFPWKHSFRSSLTILIFILMATVLTTVHAAKAGGDEERVALLIGNSAYRNTPVLPNPRNDAVELGNVLKRLGFDGMKWQLNRSYKQCFYFPIDFLFGNNSIKIF